MSDIEFTEIAHLRDCCTISYPQVRAHHISCSHTNVTESHGIVTLAGFKVRSALDIKEDILSNWPVRKAEEARSVNNWCKNGSLQTTGSPMKIVTNNTWQVSLNKHVDTLGKRNRDSTTTIIIIHGSRSATTQKKYEVYCLCSNLKYVLQVTRMI